MPRLSHLSRTAADHSLSRTQRDIVAAEQALIDAFADADYPRSVSALAELRLSLREADASESMLGPARDAVEALAETLHADHRIAIDARLAA